MCIGGSSTSGEINLIPSTPVCQNAMFFVPLGLALSEKQIPQITENTGKSKQSMELLESDSARPKAGG